MHIPHSLVMKACQIHSSSIGVKYTEAMLVLGAWAVVQPQMYAPRLKCLQVVEDVPYTTSVEILEEYNCDFCAHGGKIYMY